MVAVRPAYVAGHFYPGDPEACARWLDRVAQSEPVAAAVAAIVPHAGWVYSGATAALSWSAIAAYKPETVVLFGAVHGPDPNFASVWPEGAWRSPLGAVSVDEGLAGRFIEVRAAIADAGAHRGEHAIEVQVPFVQRWLPDAQIVPVGVRPGPQAAEVGRLCAVEAEAMGRRVAFVGSTDLTHYGPAFGFEPQGRGWAGIRWAKEVNDRRFIDLVVALKAEAVVAEAMAHHNACGSGAVAATIAAARARGATEYRELGHTCSAEIRGLEEADVVNSVGYEAGIFVLPE